MKRWIAPVLLTLCVASCDTADFAEKSSKAGKDKKAQQDTPAGTANPEVLQSTPEGVSGNGDNLRSGEASGAPGEIGVNGSGLNPGASGTDPSGSGAAIVTEGDGDKPFAGGKDDLLGDPKTPPKVVGSNKQVPPPEKQKEAIKQCLRLWGWHHPFHPDRGTPDKIIVGNLEIGPANRLIDTVLGTEFSGITDSEVTAKPSLIMVWASVNIAATDFILPTVTYKFHNPKGYYCVAFAADLASHLRVELKKGAALADGKFSLSILSDNKDPIAKHNLSILSKTDVVVVP